MVKVSVIIPVYNVEEYLGECLNSVVNQTFEDIEIICVNDGSTDNSLEILNDYALRDNRIKVLTQENKRQGAARNLGMDKSSGVYVYFMDSDDYIDLNTIEKLYDNAVSNNSDIVVSKIARFTDDGDKIDYSIPGFDFETQFKNVDFNDFTFNYKDIKQYVLNRSFAPWMKLFKKDFLLENNLQFKEHIAYEDVLYHVQTFLKADRISFSPNFFYYYRNNPTSTMNTSENGLDIFKIVDFVQQYLIENDFMDEFREEFDLFKVVQILNYIISTKSEEYFQKANIEFSKIDFSSNSLKDAFLENKFDLVINSDTLIDYIESYYNFKLNDLNQEIAVLKSEKIVLAEKNKVLLDENKKYKNIIDDSQNNSKIIKSIRKITSFRKIR